MEFLPVAVDKSHLITIGERLYSESIELIRELVNNAYDADATEARVTVSDDAIDERPAEPPPGLRATVQAPAGRLHRGLRAETKSRPRL